MRVMCWSERAGVSLACAPVRHSCRPLMLHYGGQLNRMMYTTLQMWSSWVLGYPPAPLSKQRLCPSNTRRWFRQFLHWRCVNWFYCVPRVLPVTLVLRCTLFIICVKAALLAKRASACDKVEISRNCSSAGTKVPRKGRAYAREWVSAGDYCVPYLS